MTFEILDSGGNGNVSTIIFRDSSSSSPTMRILYKSDSDSMYNSDFVEYDFKYKVEKSNFKSSYIPDLLSPEFKSLIGNDEKDLIKFEKALIPTYDYSEESDSRLSYISATTINDKTVFILDVPEGYDEVWMTDDVLDSETYIGSSATNSIDQSQFQFKVTLNTEEKKARNVIGIFIGARDDISGLNLSYRAWQENPDPARFKHLTDLRNDEYLSTIRGLNKIWSGSNTDYNGFIDTRSGSLLGTPFKRTWSLPIVEEARNNFGSTCIAKLIENSSGKVTYVFPWSSNKVYNGGEYCCIDGYGGLGLFRANNNYASNIGNIPSLEGDKFKEDSSVRNLNSDDFKKLGVYKVTINSGATGSPIPSSTVSGVLEVSLGDFDGLVQTFILSTTTAYQRKAIKEEVNSNVELVWKDWESLSYFDEAILSKDKYWEWEDEITLSKIPIFPWSEYIDYRKGDSCYYEESVYISLEDNNMGNLPLSTSHWVLESCIEENYNYDYLIKLYSSCEYETEGETTYDYDTIDFFKTSKMVDQIPEITMEYDDTSIELFVKQKPGYELDLTTTGNGKYPNLVSYDFGEDASEFVDSWTYNYWVEGNSIKRNITIMTNPEEYGRILLDKIIKSGRIVINTKKVNDCFTYPELYFIGDTTEYSPYRCIAGDLMYNYCYFGLPRLSSRVTSTSHPFPGLFDTEGIRMTGKLDRSSMTGSTKLGYITAINSDFESILEFYTRNSEDEFGADNILILDHIELESSVPESTTPILSGVTSKRKRAVGWTYDNICNVVGNTNNFKIYIKCRDLHLSAACNISDGLEFSKVRDEIPYGLFDSEGEEYVLSFIKPLTSGFNYDFDDDSEGRCIIISASFGAYKGIASFTADMVNTVFSDSSRAFTDSISFGWDINPDVRLSSRLVEGQTVIDITFAHYHYDTDILVNIKER